MRFLSTRGKAVAENAAEAIRLGLSTDGGLFVPEFFPNVYNDLPALIEKDYAENISHNSISKWNNVKWSSLSNPIGTRWATLKGTIRSQWIANSATGFKASIVFKTKTRGNLIEWFDTGVRYENGNGLL